MAEASTPSGVSTPPMDGVASAALSRAGACAVTSVDETFADSLCRPSGDGPRQVERPERPGSHFSTRAEGLYGPVWAMVYTLPTTR